MLEFCLFSVIFIFVCFFGFVIRKTGEHPENKHSREYFTVKDAYENKEYFEVWKQGKNTFHVIVEIEEGIYGDYIIERDLDNTVFEKTGFIPKDGNIKRIHNWLNDKHVVRVLNLEEEISNGYCH